jgi:phage terminase large subunit-like protein
MHMSAVQAMELAAQAEDLDLGDIRALHRRAEWLMTAHSYQIPVRSDWETWLLLAGRGAGKTRVGAEDCWWEAYLEPLRIAVIAPTFKDARKTCFEGESGVIACMPKELVLNWNRSSLELTTRSVGGGITIWQGYSAEEPDSLRGPQHHLAWCDELAAWRYLEETWDMMWMGMRLGDNPRVIATTTPRPLKTIKELVRDETTMLSRASTFENSAHLPEKFLARLRRKYQDTRLGRQELMAEILDDNPFALWKRDWIEEQRIRPLPDGKRPPLPDLERIVVAVDPPVSTGEDADECGIVVAGRLSGGERALVLEDCSSQGDTPDEWAARVVEAFDRWNADAIVAEANQGGEMVRSTILHKRGTAPVSLVHATRGKVVRAEPISSLYQQKRISHVGTFSTLEDQMCEFTSDFDKKAMGYSPDRVDALVWALTSLMPSIVAAMPRIRRL